MGLLDRKTAIITGASSGIGREAALLFAREGAKVVVVARRGHLLDSLVDEIAAAGGQAAALAADASDERAAQAMVELALGRFGALDIAFNNAGALGAPGSLPDLALDDWRRTLDANLTSAFLCAKYQIPAMLKQGKASLIFTSSFVGHAVGLPGMAAYAAAKSALVGLTRSLAAEYGAQGLRVNALLPGGTDTEMGQAATPTAEQRAWVENLHALKRLASPAEIAGAALYLASDLSGFTSGAALFADGGASSARG
ncbi:SDR family oxidoreductase [Chromobacterium subtsugae]|uniref:SDR family oxidoreductase n=2 Tax=Chromobacterium subtsugae TaxID=251747 RepID=A0ABS7FIW4_9NEIS|nr:MULTISPECIES: SDR family oxidoreductase [Chromobacterium]KZE85144.1 short-chain dehydrogenase [Chromobacterium sp. F49]MBW7569013.1 SDR family oxidoreductase [Chromobacterium subtsugae]MBW8289994.1 SDR family oxidoreductase [Chromobacterium subtsugae]OBU84723.1 short-chain dehydrogenase [Chromobacterium subtsugae]WSE92534.1 SDR family oxidoreductase [Chromobacterium subtsugae]